MTTPDTTDSSTTSTASSAAETSSRQIIGAVIVSTFFVGFGGGVVFPILPNLGAVLGISAFMVGLILSTNRFVRLFANAPAGAFVDRVGTRKPFVIGLVIEGIATFGYVIALLVPTPEANASVVRLFVYSPETWFLLARVLWGIGSALVFATAYTIAADVSDAGDRGTNMGVVRAGIMLGFPAGLVLGGVVSAIYGNVAAFVVAAGFALLASLVAYLIVPETHVEGDSTTSVKPWDVDTSIPAVTVGLVNFGIFFAYIGALFATLVLFLGANDLSILNLDAQGTSGIFMAGTVLAAGVATIGGGRLSDVYGARTPVLMVFLVLSFFGFLLLASAGSIVELAMACGFIGAGQGGTSSPLMALLADLTPNERMGRAAGTNNVFGDIGGGLGPMVSLPLVEVVGFGPLYAACALIPLLAGGVLLLGVRAETGTFIPGRRSDVSTVTE